MVRGLLSAEGAAVLATSLAVYFDQGGRWPMLAALILAPDVSMLGYLAGPRIGSVSYNAVHNYAGPVLLLGTSAVADNSTGVRVGLVWLAHLGLDRMVGYGLKYATGFKDTHMQRV